ncbi:MAG: TolC family protein [Campylobacterota bacterium]
MFRFIAVLFSFIAGLQALSLQEYLNEVIANDPKIAQSRQKFVEYALQKDITYSQYLPKVDLISSIGYAKSGQFKGSVSDQNYYFYSNILRVKQNLFSGFSTKYRLKHDKYKALSYAFMYQETLNDVAYNAVEAYLNFIQSYRLLKVAQEAVATNEKILSDVQKIYNAGMTGYSEVTKTQTSLALARSNYEVALDETQHALSELNRYLGRDVSISQVKSPKIDLIMPESMQRAAMHVLQNNPSILVKENEILSARYHYKESQSSFYPVIDATFEQHMNDREDPLIYDLPDDRSKVYLTLTWNLYNGGKDEAKKRQAIASHSANIEDKRNLRKQLLNQTRQAWNQYSGTKKQLEHFYLVKDYSAQTLLNHRVEYKVGSKTLIDLLFAHNDLIQAKREIIKTQIKRLLAQYRIMYQMGLAAESVLQEDAVAAIIQKATDTQSAKEQITLQHDDDMDKDGITDNLDLCPNSASDDNINAYGCAVGIDDSDFDGVADTKDKCPDTPIGLIVDKDGCAVIERDTHLTPPKDNYLHTPKQYDATSPQKEKTDGLYDYDFSLDISENTPSREYEKELLYEKHQLIKRFEPIFVGEDSNASINTIASFYKNIDKKEPLTMTVIGHTQTLEGDMKERSLQYANDIAQKLNNAGVPQEIMVIEGRSNSDKLFYETLPKYAAKNNRVMVALYKKAPRRIGDDDNDGVLNNVDKCPDTPPGYVVDADGCSIVIDLKVHFENDSAKIKIDTIDKIKEYAQFLKDHPKYNTLITGHTSISGNETPEYNMQLSQERAQNVKVLLIQLGIEQERITTQGMGQTQPIASNKTLEGQAKNRRIEAVMIKTSDKEEQQ